MDVTRRDFTRLLALGSAACFGGTLSDVSRAAAAQPLRPSDADDEKYWKGVRARFVIERGLAPMNAANLCPASIDVLTALNDGTRAIDRDPSQQNRARFAEAKEALRRRLASFLNVTPEEILLTRNTSEANNLVSAGLDLKAGDEVVIFSDNHPSNQLAWRERAKRHGFTVNVVQQQSPHPGSDYYIDAFTRAITAQTRLISFTHLTNTAGDLLPAASLCRLARERGVLSMVDGAQSFGLLNVDLAVMQPDFYSGSAHKWPCGAREAGVLYVRRDVQSRIWPSIYSLYSGSVGISRTHEGFGQRDEATLMGFDKALELQETVGRVKLEARSRALAQALMTELGRLDGVKLWTSPDPSLSAAVVVFQPGNLDVRKLAESLYRRDRVATATRAGTDRPGIRLSPHFYNLQEEMERVVGAVRGYLRTGL
jgi:isopenicillin-N epimerase